MGLITAAVPSNTEGGTIDTERYLFHIPEHEHFIASTKGKEHFNYLKAIASDKIVKTVWNSDWELAMCLCIAHYVTLHLKRSQQSFALSDLAERNTKVSREMSREKRDRESGYWGMTEYGNQLYTLAQSKAVPIFGVVV